MAAGDYKEIGSAPVVVAGFQVAANAISVSVTTAATALEFANPTTPTLASRKTLIIYNNGTSTIYLGGSAVTANTGIPLGVGATFTADLGAARIYGIASAGTHDVRVLELS